MQSNTNLSRNLHPDQISYLRGKRYNGEKQDAHCGENQHTRAGGQNDLQLKTADRLADKYKVSAPTIKRDGQFASAVDMLAKAGIEPPAINQRWAGELLIEMRESGERSDGRGDHSKAESHSATPVLEDLGIDKHESGELETQGKPHKDKTYHDDTFTSKRVILADLGIDRLESSRFQQVARVPEKVVLPIGNTTFPPPILVQACYNLPPQLYNPPPAFFLITT